MTDMECRHRLISEAADQGTNHLLSVGHSTIGKQGAPDYSAAIARQWRYRGVGDPVLDVARRWLRGFMSNRRVARYADAVEAMMKDGFTQEVATAAIREVAKTDEIMLDTWNLPEPIAVIRRRVST